MKSYIHYKNYKIFSDEKGNFLKKMQSELTEIKSIYKDHIKELKAKKKKWLFFQTQKG